MPNYEIVKKKKFHKKNPREKKMVTMVNLTNLLPEIWDHDNSTKKKKNNEAKSLITKCQMMIFF
jgi:hypothetical protein